MSSESMCGAVKVVQGRAVPLVCNLDREHALPHGVRESPGATPYARWPITYAPDVQQLAARAAWRKPHVRRPYQTLAMWKAGRA